MRQRYDIMELSVHIQVKVAISHVIEFSAIIQISNILGIALYTSYRTTWSMIIR